MHYQQHLYLASLTQEGKRHSCPAQQHETWHLQGKCSCGIYSVIALGVLCCFHAIAKSGCFTISVIMMLSVLLERLKEPEDQRSGEKFSFHCLF